MNTLRFYIRESLMHEAVGRVTFGKFEPTSIQYVKQGESESNFTSTILDFAKSGLKTLSFGRFSSGGKIGKAASTFRGAAASLWRSPAARLGALAFGLGAVGYGYFKNKEGDQQKSEKETDEHVQSFITEIAKIQNDHRGDIVKGLRSPEIVSLTAGGATSADDMIRYYEERYRKISQDFCDSKSFDNFKQKFESNAGYKTAITDIEGNKSSKNVRPDAALIYKQIAHRFLICTFVDEEILLDAMRQDLDVIGSRTSKEQSEAVTERLKSSTEEVWNKVTREKLYREASQDFREIMSGT